MTILHPPVNAQLLARLSSELRHSARRRLGPPLRAAFEQADESLFELAEHSRSNPQQTVYFDGMRECRRKREAVERRFLEALEQRLQKELDPLRRQQVAEGVVAPVRMALIPEDELEETLALSALAGRLESQLQRPLFALRQRLAHALGLPALDDTENPLGPTRFGEDFRRAYGLLDVTMEVRLLLLKLFERQLPAALELLYEEANDRLAEAGVLPVLRGPRRGTDAHTGSAPQPAAQQSQVDAGRPASAAGGSPDAAAAMGHAADAFDSAALVEAVHSLLAQVRSHQPGGLAAANEAFAAEAPVASQWDTNTLHSALSLLQREVSGNAQRQPGPAHELKQALMHRARELSAGASGALSVDHENTVDTVGLLFDFVMRDSNLPGPLQPLLARLHVPFLRAALDDPDVLRTTAHPLRQLLDSMGDAAIGWSESSDPGRRTYMLLEDTIQRLLDQDQDDPQLVANVLDEFRTALEVSQRHAELAEHRTVDASAGKERLQLARQRVATALRERLRGELAPIWAVRLLGEGWTNHLVLLWLRQGEESPAYAAALAFADELISCARRDLGAEQRDALRERVPALEQTLRQGLAMVAFHDSEIDRLAAELRLFVEACLGEAEMEEALQPAAIEDFGPQPGEDQPMPEQLDTELLQRMGELQPGTWFEFVRNGEQERGKLSWISPISGRCVFVNRAGVKVADKALDSLADEIERGLVRILEATHLVHRALTSIVDEMRSDTGTPQHPQ